MGKTFYPYSRGRTGGILKGCVSSPSIRSLLLCADDGKRGFLAQWSSGIFLEGSTLSSIKLGGGTDRAAERRSRRAEEWMRNQILEEAIVALRFT
jgi:glucose-6-phosphate-specific signal transduction histidine kinase